MEGSKSICFYICNKPSSVIWNIVNDISQLNYLLCENKIKLLSEPIFYYLQTSKDVGAIFSFNFLSTYMSYFKVEKIIETDYWYHCQWKAYYSIPSQPLFNFSMTIHTLEENSCLIEYKMLQFINYQFYFCEVVLKHQVLESINRIAAMSEDYKIQIGGIAMRCSFLSTVGVILNIKLLQKHVPLLCDELECEDEELKNGTLVKMTFNRTDSIGKPFIDFALLKVIRLDYQHQHHQNFVLRLESIQQSEGIPSQEIECSVQMINNDTSYLNIKHIFKQAIPRKFLRNYEKKKERVLKEIKGLCERVQYKVMIRK